MWRRVPLPRATLLPTLVLALLALFVQPTPPPAAAAGERCFPETGFCIAGRFRAYWEQQGGLAVFGFPVSAPRDEVNRENGRSYLTQWFERVRFEAHPENAPPYDVLLGRIGVERLQLQDVAWQNLPQATGPQPGCRWFPETRHNLCDQAQGRGFLQFWQGHGLLDPGLDAYGRSLALFGLPLSETTVEVSPTDGRPYLTQWFERARFEWHPEQGDPQYQVLLGLLGNEVLRAPRLIGGGSIDLLVAGGDLVVWVEQGGSTAFDLYVYNAGTDSRRLIDSSPSTKLSAATDGRLVVWVQTPPGGASSIELYDTATGERRTLLQAPAFTDVIGGLAVADGVVYSEQSIGEQRGLFALDLASGRQVRISPTGREPVASDGLLLWTETTAQGTGPAYRATHRLLLRHIDGSRPDVEVGRLDDPNGFSRYAIAGGRVAWGGFQWPIVVYDIVDGASTTVAPTGFRATWLGEQVLWSLPLPEGLGGILAWNPASGGTTTVLSEAGMGWNFVGVGDGTVVYERTSATGTRGIYRFDLTR